MRAIRSILCWIYALAAAILLWTSGSSLVGTLRSGGDAVAGNFAGMAGLITTQLMLLGIAFTFTAACWTYWKGSGSARSWGMAAGTLTPLLVAGMMWATVHYASRFGQSLRVNELKMNAVLLGIAIPGVLAFWNWDPAEEGKVAELETEEEKVLDRKAAERVARVGRAAEEKASERVVEEEKAPEWDTAEGEAEEEKAAEGKAGEWVVEEEKVPEWNTAEGVTEEEKGPEGNTAEGEAEEEKAVEGEVAEWVAEEEKVPEGNTAVEEVEEEKVLEGKAAEWVAEAEKVAEGEAAGWVAEEEKVPEANTAERVGEEEQVPEEEAAVDDRLTKGNVGSGAATALRPRDFDIRAMELAAATITKGAPAVHLKLLEFCHYLDSGRLWEATLALNEAEAAAQESGAEVPVEFYGDIVFGKAFVQRDPEGTRQWWERMEAEKPVDFDADYWAARCAYLWMEGRPEEAREAWEQGNALAEQLPKGGAHEFKRDKFARLLGELEAKRRVPRWHDDLALVTR